MYTSHGFKLRDFDTMVKKSRMALRHGILDVFAKANEHDFPLVVISGGVKTVIEAAFNIVLMHIENWKVLHHGESPSLTKQNSITRASIFQQLLDKYNTVVVSNELNFEADGPSPMD